MQKRETNRFGAYGHTRSDDRRSAFTLLEVLTALAILALTASSVLFVVSQSVSAAADSVFRMEAFDLARENMEHVLTSPSVTEMVDFGTSEIHPNISWQTVVEAFSEPSEGAMWLRAVCTAEFVDSKGETQKVELVHWLAPLTDQQAARFMQGEDTESLSAEQIIESNENAAEYAKVDVATIEQWLNNGLVVLNDGAFLRYNLDIFVRSKGNPSEAARAKQVHSIEELAAALKDTTDGQDGTSQIDQPDSKPDSIGANREPSDTGPPMRRGLRNPNGN
jgi:prepilin-type N-terminal cleavage/methylation domain-containing protein